MPKSPTGFWLAIEYFREEDGRWLAESAALPGVTAYGRTRKQGASVFEPCYFTMTTYILQSLTPGASVFEPSVRLVSRSTRS